MSDRWLTAEPIILATSARNSGAAAVCAALDTAASTNSYGETCWVTSSDGHSTTLFATSSSDRSGD
jgi:hypothetical protein